MRALRGKVTYEPFTDVILSHLAVFCIRYNTHRPASRLDFSPQQGEDGTQAGRLLSTGACDGD